ncbi:COP signalosome [Salix suchowensis]|nr:COP signalosome [Salix suchowensis]
MPKAEDIAGKSDVKAGPDTRGVPLDPPPPYYTEAGSSSSSPEHRNNECMSTLRRRIASCTRVDVPLDLRAPMRADTVENALQTLRKYDTVLIIDDSGSMLGSKWRQAEKSLAALADMAGKYDTDGIDVAFLNSTKVGEGIRASIPLNAVNDPHLKFLQSGKEVQRLFLDIRPYGHTPIGERLESLLLTYLARIEGAQRQGVLNTIKPVNYVIITDGEPRIVDTTPFQATKGEVTADLITKILIGGINRRVDRKGVAATVVS